MFECGAQKIAGPAGMFSTPEILCGYTSAAMGRRIS